MKDFKQFFLCYYNGSLMKKNVNDSKCYFYNFLGEDSYDTYELQRITELEKQIVDKNELKLISDKKVNLNINLKRNSHIFNETVIEIKSKKYKYDIIYQALWLKNIIKYYPNQEEFILRDYGHFVYEIAKNMCLEIDSNIDSLVERILDFANEYKNIILFAINSLGDIKCNLLNTPKINHALQLGIETYLNGYITNDGIIAAILFDVLQYAPNNELIRRQIINNTYGYNGRKVLDIFDKTGQNPNLKNSDWKIRKYSQIGMLSTPGISSFSGSTILAISQKITLSDIGQYFKQTFEENTTQLQLKKENFWNNYSNISETEAKEYYSEIFNILCKKGNLKETLLNDYENMYCLVFNEYPL